MIEDEYAGNDKLIDQAVEKFTAGEWNEEDIISFLRANPNNIAEFCLRTHEAYRGGDNTGIIKLSMIIDKLL